MKFKKYTYSVLIMFLICCSSKKEKNTTVEKAKENKENVKIVTPTVSKQTGLKTDLGKYEGFYSSNESTDGRISPENLPKELLNNNANIKSVSIDYLERFKTGFILTFNINYEENKSLVVSTLDQGYNMVDYRIYPNGRSLSDIKKDTITLLTYNKNLITVEIMHLNPDNEPEFSTDGIKKEDLEISDDLKLEKKR